jgi:hypothetical protein
MTSVENSMIITCMYPTDGKHEQQDGDDKQRSEMYAPVAKQPELAILFSCIATSWHLFVNAGR